MKILKYSYIWIFAATSGIMTACTPDEKEGMFSGKGEPVTVKFSIDTRVAETDDFDSQVKTLRVYAFQNGSPSCLRILSGFLSQGNHGQIVPVCQTLMDTQTSRACLSVNKYLYSHFSTSFPCRTIRAGRFSADDHCFRRFCYVRLRCRHCLSLHIVHNVDIILFGTFLR